MTKEREIALYLSEILAVERITTISFPRLIAELEIATIEYFESCYPNYVTEMAKHMKMPRTTLSERMKRLGLRK